MRRFVASAFGFVALAALLPAGPGCTTTSTNGVTTCTDAHAVIIQASSYDQSCRADSDCVAVGEGNACGGCNLSCTNAAINVGAHSQYLSDLAKTPAGSTSECAVSCAVGSGLAPCCREGSCHADSQCSAAGDASPDGASSAACVSDANVLLIKASDYDQSCTVDTDCRVIAEGNACTPCAFDCSLGGAINSSALTKYMSDVANTPAVATEFNGQTCASGCPAEFGPCCVGGKCQTSPTGQCPALGDAGYDAADTGADAKADAAIDACTPSGCTGSCISGAHNVSTLVGGCVVWQCCVPDDGGADAAGEGGVDAGTQ